MNFKDCLFGQVRKLNGYPHLHCTDLPNDLRSLVTKQEIVTWDNATGMNPLYDTLSSDVILSYGEMLEKSQDMGSVWICALTHGNFSAFDFEECIKDDYSNEITLICKQLSQWWLTDYILNRPDVLNYDYVILRQIDTLFNPIASAELLMEELSRSNRKVFRCEDIPTGIPVCYDLSLDMDRRHASSTMIPSHAFILNRSAIKILKDSFYQLALAETDRYYTLLGQDNFTVGDPGVIMHRICVKQDVEPLSVREIFLRPEDCRGGEKGGLVDYSNIDRCDA